MCYFQMCKNHKVIDFSISKLDTENSPFVVAAYQPDYLDDPDLTELTAGKNRTCLKFASYAVSLSIGESQHESSV